MRWFLENWTIWSRHASQHAVQTTVVSASFRCFLNGDCAWTASWEYGLSVLHWPIFGSIMPHVDNRRRFIAGRRILRGSLGQFFWQWRCWQSLWALCTMWHRNGVLYNCTAPRLHGIWRWHGCRHATRTTVVPAGQCCLSNLNFQNSYSIAGSSHKGMCWVYSASVHWTS